MVQAARLAGSGPSFAPYGFRARLTRAAIVPGPTRTRAPPSSTSIRRQYRPTSTRTPSVWAWPDKLVPAARKVIGTSRSRHRANSAWISTTDSASTTALGIRR